MLYVERTFQQDQMMSSLITNKSFWNKARQ